MITKKNSNKALFIAVSLLAASNLSQAQEPKLTVARGPDQVTARMSAMPVSLADGRVVLVGGRGQSFVSLASAEVLDAAGTAFSQVVMPFPADATAVARMADGKYLVAGGSADWGIPAYGNAAIFDPATLTFTTTGSMVRFRVSAGSAALKSGKVLFAGAWWMHNDAHTYGDLYDPGTGTFSGTGGLSTPRARPLVFPTEDGQAVVFGGVGYTGTAMDALPEIYNPDQNTFTKLGDQLFAGETGWRADGSGAVTDALRLPDGKFVFLANRVDGAATAFTLGTFDPVTKTFAKFDTAEPVTFAANPAYQPVVDRTRNVLLMPSALNNADGSTDFSVVRIDLVSHRAETFTGKLADVGYKVSFDSTMVGLLADGRLVIAGGNNGSDYFTSYAKTILLTLPTSGPKLSVALYAGLTIEGKVGTAYNIQSAASPESPQWTTITNITLPQSPYLWFDLSSAGVPKRFYQAVEAR